MGLGPVEQVSDGLSDSLGHCGRFANNGSILSHFVPKISVEKTFILSSSSLFVGPSRHIVNHHHLDDDDNDDEDDNDDDDHVYDYHDNDDDLVEN